MEREAYSDSRHALFQRLIWVARTEGLRGLARRVIARGQRIFSVRLSYLVDYQIGPDALVPVTGADVQVQIVGPDDQAAIHEMAHMHSEPVSEVETMDRMARNDLCCVVRAGGKIAGYIWVRQSGEVMENGKILLVLREDEVYAHDVYILPEQRGKNLFPVMKATLARLLAETQGKQHMYSFVHLSNRASQHGSRKVGALRAGWVVSVRFMGRRHPFLIRRRPVKL